MFNTFRTRNYTKKKDDISFECSLPEKMHSVSFMITNDTSHTQVHPSGFQAKSSGKLLIIFLVNSQLPPKIVSFVNYSLETNKTSITP